MCDYQKGPRRAAGLNIEEVRQGDTALTLLSLGEMRLTRKKARKLTYLE